MRKKTPPDAAKLFWEIAADLMSEHPSVVEGTIMNGRCLRVGTEFLALVDRSGLVVKLSKARVDELLASGAGQPFAPAGRVFKDWVSVPTPDRRRWRALLQEGVMARLAGGAAPAQRRRHGR